MEYRERKSITPEEAVVLWQTSRLSLSKTYEKAPEILKVHNSVIGTLGNFSASIGKAKSKKTFNVSAIVAAALTNGIVLQYAAALPEDKRKILYVDTEQSPYHCLKVARRILRQDFQPTETMRIWSSLRYASTRPKSASPLWSRQSTVPTISGWWSLTALGTWYMTSTARVRRPASFQS